MAEILRVNGYHGTSQDVAKIILRDGCLFSRNAYDWLGDGVYFWQDAPNRAWDWVQQQHGANAAVLHSVIRLENCMDLFDIGWAEILASSYDDFADELQQANLSLPMQTLRAHRIDRSVLNYCIDQLAGQGTIIQCIRSVFVEGGPIFPKSALYTHSHVQIAVRDLSLIERTALIESEEA